MKPVGFDEFDSLVEWASKQPNSAESICNKIENNLPKIRNRLVRHPLVKEYVSKGQEPNTKAWHALGEQLTTAVVCASGVYDFDGSVDREVLSAWLCACLFSAQPFLIRRAPHEAVDASPSLPSHKVSRNVFPYPLMFLSHETALLTDHVALPKDLVGLEVDSSLIVVRKDHVQIVGFGMAQGKAKCLRFQPMYFGQWPEDFAENERPGVEFLLKLMAFMQTSVFEVSNERLSRPQRRRMQRAGIPKESVDPTIRVVQLRRTERVRGSSDGKQPERHHHWWVRGHWRAQWYPSEQAHHPKWIHPHMKGDMDKPFLEKVYDVCR